MKNRTKTARSVRFCSVFRQESSSFRFKVRRQHSLQVKSIAKFRKPGFRAPNIPAQSRKQNLTKMAIQGHSRLRVLESADSADHGPLPHISAGHVIVQFLIN